LTAQEITPRKLAPDFTSISDSATTQVLSIACALIQIQGNTKRLAIVDQEKLKHYPQRTTPPIRSKPGIGSTEMRETNMKATANPMAPRDKTAMSSPRALLAFAALETIKKVWARLRRLGRTRNERGQPRRSPPDTLVGIVAELKNTK
jgi:hypothetical protein